MDVGEKIFYPMHGAGLIKSIEDKDLGDYCERFYVIELPFEQIYISSLKKMTLINLNLENLSMKILLMRFTITLTMKNSLCRIIGYKDIRKIQKDLSLQIFLI
mgnify:CR=1 FL=1